MKIKLYKKFRSFATATLAIAFLVPALSFTTNAQNNLLTNGGFEDDMTGWEKAREQDEASILSGNAFAGTKALLVGPGGWSAVEQTVTTGIVPGATYRLSAAGKSATGTAIKKVGLQVVSGTDLVAMNFDSPDWVLKSIEFTMPADATQFLVYLNNRAGGEAHFDEVKVELVETEVAVTGVTLNETTATLEIGETTTLVATVSPADATDKSVTWTSSDETVATVDENGVVTAVAEGTATITVTTTDGNLTADAILIVTPAESQEVNLLINGSFEDDLDSWTGKAGDVVIETDPGHVAHGSKSVKVGPTSWSWLQQSFTGWEAGKTYRFTITAKTEAAGQEVRVSLKTRLPGEGSDTDLVRHTVNTTDFAEYTGTFTVPEGIGFLQVYMTNRGTSAVGYIDNLIVTEVEEPTPIAVTGVSLNETAATLKVYETTTLVATVSPADAADKSVTWTSSDDTVATVDEDGVVTAVAAGTATITVTTTDGDFTADATITVVEFPFAITPTDDSYVREDNPETIYHLTNAEELQVRLQSETQRRYTYMKFDVPQALEGIAYEAFLTLWAGNVGDTTGLVIEVVTAGNDWAEETLNFTNRPDFTNNIVPVEFGFPYPEQDFGYVEVDVSSLVKDHEGQTITLALRYKDINTENLKIFSKDQADMDKVPSLVFQEPTPVAEVSLSLTKFHLSLGDDLQLDVVVGPEDAADQSITWSSSDESVATVDYSGLVTAVMIGETVITVTTNDGGFTATTEISVVDNLVVNGSFEESVTEDNITTITGWTHPAPQVQLRSFFPVHGANHLTFTARNAEAVQVVNDLIPGATYVLSGFIRNNPHDNPQEIRMGVRFNENDSLVIAVDAQAWLTEPYEIEFTLGAEKDSAEIFIQDVSGSGWKYADYIVLQYKEGGPAVTDVSVNLSKLNLAYGDNFQLHATFEPADAAVQFVHWESSDENIVTVDNNGVLTAVSYGEAVITATTVDGGFTATTDINVVHNLVANGSFEDGISEDGNITGWTHPAPQVQLRSFFPLHGANHLTFTARDAEATQEVTGLLPEATYVLSGFVRNNPHADPQEIRMGVRFNENDSLVIAVNMQDWSTEPYVLEFTLGADQNSAEIFIQDVSGSGWKYADYIVLYHKEGGNPVTNISLNLTKFHLASGDSVQLDATVEPEDADIATVTWSSSDETIATVDNTGLVTAVANGEVVITVTTDNHSYTATTEILVVDNLVVNGSFEDAISEDGNIPGWTHPAPQVQLRSFFPVHGTNHLTFTARNAEATQEVTGLLAGGTYVLSGFARNNPHDNPQEIRMGVRYNENDSLYIAVNKQDWTTEPYVFEFTLDEGQNSAEIFIIDISGSGWKYADYFVLYHKEGGEAVAVTGVTLNETAVSLLVGETFNLEATVAPEEASNTNVNWSSSNDAVATVSDAGVVTAVAAGEATITVTTVDGEFTASAVVTVEIDDTSADELSLTSLNVYPNPVRDGKLFVTNPNFGQHVTVQLISVDGRIVMSERISEAGQTLSVDISSNIENGLYILSVTDENRNYTSRIIISN